MVGFEGPSPPQGARRSAMWAWDGSRWSPVSREFGEPAASPTPPLVATSNGLLLLDGAIVQGNAAITWLWRDGAWLRSGVAPPIPQRVSHAMAYDSRRNRVVMFGGHAGFGPGRTGEMYGDTWEWTGQTWERVPPR